MTIIRNQVHLGKFNPKVILPYELRHQDFQMALQDVYDFFFDVNSHLTSKGLQRLDDMLRPAIMSGVLSDMLTASLAKHSRALTENKYFNGHPDLIVQGTYAGNSVKAGVDGVEIKTTRKAVARSILTALENSGCVYLSTMSTLSRNLRPRDGR